MSGGFLGSMFGVSVADQAHANNMAGMDAEQTRQAINHNAHMASLEADIRENEAAIRANEANADAVLREKGTRELIQHEAQETRKWIGGTNDNVNGVHQHIDDQSDSLKKFMGEQNESQSAAIQEVLTVVHELTDKVDHLQTEIDELKRERA